jgi:hypothetical protein
MNANTKRKLSDNMIWLVLIVLVIIMSHREPELFHHRELKDTVNR